MAPMAAPTYAAPTTYAAPMTYAAPATTYAAPVASSVTAPATTSPLPETTTAPPSWRCSPRLTQDQVIYHFIAGYTSKMAGTEEGITKPVAAFSSCYGEPFLVWHPVKYATMLAERLTQHNATAWLLNTGWVGGAKGRRCPLRFTRAIVDAIHSGELAKVETRTDPVFGLPYPVSCAGVPSELLDPSSSWADKADFQRTQAELAALFAKNFTKYAAECSAEVIACGPKA